MLNRSEVTFKPYGCCVFIEGTRDNLLKLRVIGKDTVIPKGPNGCIRYFQENGELAKITRMLDGRLRVWAAPEMAAKCDPDFLEFMSFTKCATKDRKGMRITKDHHADRKIRKS